MKTLEKPPLDTPKTELEILRAEHAALQVSYSEVKERLSWLLRQLFGKKSEKVTSGVSSSMQLEFEGFSVETLTSPIQPDPEPKPRRKPVRDGKDSIKLPADLPVKTTIIDIPEEDKICKETGLPLVKIGEEITYKLSHTPGSYFIKEFIRFKYANPNREEQGVFCADLPSTIFPKCRADDSVLADILVKKFADHLPLYRISEIMGRDNIGISRKLLSQWVMHCGAALTPSIQ